MDKEYDNEKIARIIGRCTRTSSCKKCLELTGNKGCYNLDAANKILNAGYGDIKKAITEFAEKVGFLFCPECDYDVYDIRETIINYAKEFISK